METTTQAAINHAASKAASHCLSAAFAVECGLPDRVREHVAEARKHIQDMESLVAADTQFARQLLASVAALPGPAYVGNERCNREVGA